MVARGRLWLLSLPSRLPSEMTADLPLRGEESSSRGRYSGCFTVRGEEIAGLAARLESLLGDLVEATRPQLRL